MQRICRSISNVRPRPARLCCVVRLAAGVIVDCPLRYDLRRFTRGMREGRSETAVLECGICCRQTLQVEPSNWGNGSRCSICRQQTLHLGPAGSRDGTECRLCCRQTLHLEPPVPRDGAGCRLCRQQTLHLEPSGPMHGTECRLCCQQTLHLEPTSLRNGTECSPCRPHTLQVEPGPCAWRLVLVPRLTIREKRELSIWLLGAGAR